MPHPSLERDPEVGLSESVSTSVPREAVKDHPPEGTNKSVSGPWSSSGQGVKTAPERGLTSRGKHARFSVKPWGNNRLVFRT